MTRFLAIIILATGTTGCLSFLSPSTVDPAATTADALKGAWAPVSSGSTAPNTCTDFHWTVADVTGTTASGGFTAKCLGTMPVSGIARGTLSGETLAWTVTATGITPAGLACPVSLTGTATFDGTQIRVPYTGTTCLGSVSGAEILRR